MRFGTSAQPGNWLKYKVVVPTPSAAICKKVCRRMYDERWKSKVRQPTNKSNRFHGRFHSKTFLLSLLPLAATAHPLARSLPSTRTPMARPRITIEHAVSCNGRPIGDCKTCLKRLKEGELRINAGKVPYLLVCAPDSIRRRIIAKDPEVEVLDIGRADVAKIVRELEVMGRRRRQRLLLSRRSPSQ